VKKWKNSDNLRGGGDFLTHTVQYLAVQSVLSLQFFWPWRFLHSCKDNPSAPQSCYSV